MGTTALVLTVNPDAGRSSPTSFRSDAIYQFSVDTRGGTDPDLVLTVQFGAPDEHGRQSARGERGHAQEISLGRKNEIFDLVFPDGSPGRGWAGLAADPFWGNGAALFAFLQAAAEGRYSPEVFAAGGNIFEGRNVTAIVLEIPDALLGFSRSSVWATIHLHGHAPERQVSRMRQPMLRPLFFNTPGPETEQLNPADPSGDRARHRRRLVAAATALASLTGQDSDVHARSVADAFLPDVLGYTAGELARFHPGVANGMSLTDDAFGVAIAFVTGQEIAGSSAPAPTSPVFPYVGRPDGTPGATRRTLRPAPGGSHPDERSWDSARPA